MHQYEIPAGPSPVAPRIEAFAMLAGLEAAVRGILISVMPLAMYDASGSAEAVSQSDFLAGLGSLIWGLMVPWATRFVPRRWMYSLGCGLYILSMGFAMLPHAGPMPLALLCMVLATATCFVCFNAYVLDYVARHDLGRAQSLQMFYAAAPWAIGPVAGVWLRDLWAPLPFLLAMGFALALLTLFWWLPWEMASKSSAPAARRSIRWPIWAGFCASRG